MCQETQEDRMSKPIPDKAEVTLEYPDKFYIGTFERTARFDAHLDENGISLTFQRGGDPENKKSVCMHLHYALFAEILRDLAMTVPSLPPQDTSHLDVLRDAAKALYASLVVLAARYEIAQSNNSRAPALWG
jgi:hypothetical protein